MWAILSIDRSGVSSDDDVPAEKTDFSSHDNISTTISLYIGEVSIFERFSHSNYLAIHTLDNSFFSFVVVKWCGGNSNAISSLPVNVFDHLKLYIIRVNSRCDLGPGVSDTTMHVKSAVSAGDHLISENRQLFIIVTSVESENQIMLEWFSFSSSLELTSINNKVMSIESKIFYIFEYDFTLYDHRVEDWGALINKKSHSHRNRHRVTFSWNSFSAPGILIWPSVHIEEGLSIHLCWAVIGNHWERVTVSWWWRASSCCAHDLCGCGT